MYEGKLSGEALRAVFLSDQWFLFHLIIFRSKFSFAVAWCLTRPSVMPCGCSGQSVSPLCRLAQTRRVFSLWTQSWCSGTCERSSALWEDAVSKQQASHAVTLSHAVNQQEVLFFLMLNVHPFLNISFFLWDHVTVQSFLYIRLI